MKKAFTTQQSHKDELKETILASQTQISQELKDQILKDLEDQLQHFISKD